MEFFGYETDNFCWILNEGKMVKSFLHLEDIKSDCSIKDLWNGTEFISGSDSILPTLLDFHSHLYECIDVKQEEEIKSFLEQLDGLPVISTNFESFLGPITFQEIKTAIKKLCLNKSLGIDGLTVEFYKHFCETISPILELVFNEVFADQYLSFTQRVAIIILLFKKGEHTKVGNYRLISLTTCDYKILAYILTARLSNHFPDIIQPSQTAYIESRFIGTNIRGVQDMIDFNSENNTDGLVLFLDFKKAFDSVSHAFLFTLLCVMQVPECFIQWIQIMYHNTLSCMKHNN